MYVIRIISPFTIFITQGAPRQDVGTNSALYNFLIMMYNYVWTLCTKKIIDIVYVRRERTKDKARDWKRLRKK